MVKESTGVEDLLRQEAPQVLGALVRRLGRFDIAEDAVQEALLAASEQWPVDGVPREPRSWLIRVGYRRMIDLLRAEQARHRRELEIGAAELARPASPVPATDDSLTLLLMCCHPALSTTSQVALTLRAVGGLTTAEIAHAYGANEATMGTRISRAKQQLVRTGARFRPPDDADRQARMTAVMQVLYLVYNEGYTATAGESLGRIDLAEEAIRLARLLHGAAPDDAEASGLLALMLLTESRRAARTRHTTLGLVPLADQDRSRWNRELIDEGAALLDRVWTRHEPGPYQIQAAIAALHARASIPEETDWSQIAALYLWLERFTPTAPVRLSRVVAVAQAFGPDAGLDLLERLDRLHGLADDPLVRQRVHAVQGHLLDERGQTEPAAEHYRAAADLTENRAERAYLLDRADRAAHRSGG